MTRMNSIAVFTAILFLTTPAAAEVSDVAASGFEIRETIHIAATPDKVYAALIEPAHWWNSAHTFSGDATNLTFDARADGCWCEKLPNGGSVEHMKIVFAAPGSTLRLTGALGPFQSFALAGVMTWKLKAADGGTDLTLSYAMAGYIKGGFADLPKAADEVLGEQIGRLKLFTETGSPTAAH